MRTQERTDSRHLTMTGDRASDVAGRARTAHDLLASAWAASSRTGRLAVVAVAAAAVASGFVPGVPLAAALTVAAGVPAVVVDLHVRRLPDALVAAAAIVGLVTAVLTALAGAPTALGAVALGALAMGGPILLLHLVSPRSMGFGDVKLGAVLGAALGVLHWQLALSGLALAAGLSSVVALLGRRNTIAFGPGLLAGALLALLAHPVLIPTGPEASAARVDSSIPNGMTSSAARVDSSIPNEVHIDDEEDR